jgi:FG-GAP repeat
MGEVALPIERGWPGPAAGVVLLLLVACQAPGPTPQEAGIPAGRTLVRDGLGRGGDVLVAIDDAPARCRAPQAWRRAGAGWREVAHGGPALADATCPPVTARLAADGRTLAVYDYGAGRAEVLDVSADRITSAGAASVAAPPGFPFPPPGPNLAFSQDARQLLLGSINRGCRPRADGGRACGLAELFEHRNGGEWERAATFLPAPERDGLIRFGQSVALAPDGSVALVGGTGQPGRSGALWVFALDPGGEPRLVQILAPRKRREGGFANDLALSGDGRWLAVGGEQSVHLYERAGRDGFAFRKLLTAPDPDAGYFGETVTLSGDGRRLLVGAPRSACAEGERCGTAYLFERDRLWRLARTIRPATETADANFGHHVALSADGRHAAVQGKVLHVFTLEGGGG